MTMLAPTLQAFFTDRLARQFGASPHTIAAYRDTWRLLLSFAAAHIGTAPTNLDIGQLDAPLIAAFLDHLQAERGNTVRTRNTRLAAIRSVFRFAALRHPEHVETIARVLAIPPKRYDRTEVAYLTPAEVAALLAAPDANTWAGRRDRAWILLALTSGLRVSELTLLTRADLHLRAGPHVRCHGKGRRERITPVTTETRAVLKAWLNELPTDPATPLFPTRTGTTMSRDAMAARLDLHAQQASKACPSLTSKKTTPHVLRHTAAMRLLHAGVDVLTIALWLGHASSDTTQMYVHADLALKERAIARTTPLGTKPGRYQPDDRLLAFLESL
jgi:site-specific recombinase XerD